MKATIHATCLPKSKKADYEAEDIVIEVDLPFIPSVGMKLKATRNGEFLKVDDVYLDLTLGDKGLHLYMEEPDDISDLRPWTEMRAEGWGIDVADSLSHN